MQFVSGFVNQAKRRIREMNGELGKMPPMLTTEIQRRNAFYKAISTVKQGMRDIMVMGNNETICGKGDHLFNVVPQVTTMYKKYANNMTKVSPPRKFGCGNYLSQVCGKITLCAAIRLVGSCSYRDTFIILVLCFEVCVCTPYIVVQITVCSPIKSMFAYKYNV